MTEAEQKLADALKIVTDRLERAMAIHPRNGRDWEFVMHTEYMISDARAALLAAESVRGEGWQANEALSDIQQALSGIVTAVGDVKKLLPKEAIEAVPTLPRAALDIALARCIRVERAVADVIRARAPLPPPKP